MGKAFTASEVKSHNSRNSCWIVIRNDVYDVTNFLGEHPGGEDPLLDSAGMDATTAFEEVGHSSSARRQLKKYKIGSLAPGEACSRLHPRLWMSSGPPTIVYRCENDEKPCRNVNNPSNRSTPNRSKTPSLQKCYSKSEASMKKPKSGTSLHKMPSKSRTSPTKAGSKSTLASKRSFNKLIDPQRKSTQTPIPVPRVSSIVVPRERSRRPPPSGSKLKWALLALAIAVVAGVAYKKYAT